MKKVLLATTALMAFAIAPASAADLAPKMVTKAPALAVWDWTGFYLGGYVGVGVQKSSANDPTGTRVGNIDLIGSGFTGGVTAGYNWQATRNIVIGAEGDFGYLGLDRSAQNWNDNLITNQKTSWIATLRGRAGWSNGPTLSYVTAGAAWVNREDSINNAAGTLPASSTTTKGGWTWGTGTEVMLGGGWTAKSEYLDVRAGSGNVLNNTAFSYQADPTRYQIQRFGVNYIFGAKPQPAFQPHNWNGGYVGIVAGGASSENKAVQPAGVTIGEIDNHASGYTAGGQIGYNWQFAPMWVAGVEGDFSYLGVNRAFIDFFDAGRSTGVETSWVATARARLGYAVGPSLLYVTGGGAWVKVTDKSASGTGLFLEESKTLSGYTVGAGIETVLAGNWSSRTEYLYIDAGSGNVIPSTNPIQFTDHNFHLFRSALTYKFGG